MLDDSLISMCTYSDRVGEKRKKHWNAQVPSKVKSILIATVLSNHRLLQCHSILSCPFAFCSIVQDTYTFTITEPFWWHLILIHCILHTFDFSFVMISQFCFSSHWAVTLRALPQHVLNFAWLHDWINWLWLCYCYSLCGFCSSATSL